MNTFKSHFTFTKKQRNGIFLLLAIISGLQIVYYVMDFSEDERAINTRELALFYQEMDSLRLVEIEKRKPKIYPFNPNFITDYKGYTLGMSNEEIDRLLAFREQNLWINSTAQFKDVTLVSDSLLTKISPYFKFPDWVTESKTKNVFQKPDTYNDVPKSYDQKIDLNLATETQLKKVYGIGPAYAQRIIKYRDNNQGFVSNVELQEVYGLSADVIGRILKDFTVKTPKSIIQLNLNTATQADLVKIPYIDYEIAHYILEYKTLNEGFEAFEELMKVKDFPRHKIEIIKLYLTLE